MQLQLQENPYSNPFQIIHNARTSKTSNARKSSISSLHTIDKEKLNKKKLRKMTMNDISLQYVEIKENDEFAKDQKQIHSEKGDAKQNTTNNIEDYFDFGMIKNGMQPQQQQFKLQLQKGISCGVLYERQLDSDFDLSCSRNINEQFMKD